MTKLIHTENDYYSDKRGSVINCDTCSEPDLFSINNSFDIKFALLYETVEVPKEYSCEFLNRYNGVISCFGNTCLCEDGLQDYYLKSRTASCKNEYCVSNGGYIFRSFVNWDYDREWSIFTQSPNSTALTNTANYATLCSNDYHKENPYSFISGPPFEKKIDYNFEIIVETYEIDMETYIPGYVCVEEEYVDNPNGSPLQGTIFDFNYRDINCHAPDVNCDGDRFSGSADGFYKNQGACSKLVDPDWTEVAKEVVKIEKIYSYQDCGKKIGNDISYTFDPTRDGEYCELCSPDSNCWPSGASDLFIKSWGLTAWYNLNTVLNRMGNLNPKCCSRTVTYSNETGNMHVFSNTVNGWRSPKCGSGIVEEYECVSNYKNLKCIDGEVKRSNFKENAGLCASCDTPTIQTGPYVPQDKQLDANNKITYKVKQNQTIEQTITTYLKKEKQPNPYIEATKKDPLYSNSALWMAKTKYVESKTVDNYKIIVTFAYCKGTPKPC